MEDIRILQNKPGQIDTGLFPAGQGGEETGAHIFINAQAVAHLVQLSLGIIAPRRLEGGGQPVVSSQHLRGCVLPHLCGQLLHLPLHGMERGEGGVQHVPDGVPLRINGNLGDQPQPLARGNGNRPLVGVDLPGHDAEDRGLARAVAAQ